jgi:hypothetical protein
MMPLANFAEAVIYAKLKTQRVPYICGSQVNGHNLCRSLPVSSTQVINGVKSKPKEKNCEPPSQNFTIPFLLVISSLAKTVCMLKS